MIFYFIHILYLILLCTYPLSYFTMYIPAIFSSVQCIYPLHVISLCKVLSVRIAFFLHVLNTCPLDPTQYTSPIFCSTLCLLYLDLVCETYLSFISFSTLYISKLCSTLYIFSISCSTLYIASNILLYPGHILYMFLYTASKFYATLLILFYNVKIL